MIKSNVTVAETQLKARRTSLGKKSNEDLINIILRKDKTERSQSAKINSLTRLLNEADELNENKVGTIVELRDKCNSTYDRLQAEIEKNGNLQQRINNAEVDMNGTLKEIARLKYKCNLLRKIIIGETVLFVIIIMFIVLGF